MRFHAIAKLVCLAWFTLLASEANLLWAVDVVIAEGEKFQPQGEKGWKVTHQNDSYASHTYGGMWMTHGGCLSAPADSVGAVAVQQVTIPVAGQYRVWSKYQAPPYFNYLHKIEVEQGGKVVYSHVYGAGGTERLWSFSGESNELWWFWGVDHDAAEAPATLATLAAGPAVIKLSTVAPVKPAGDRMVDFVVLTTNPASEYVGFKPYAVGSPFSNEALAATKLYLRFQNTAAAPAKLSLSRGGHFQPQYGGATTMIPEEPTAAGQWSSWVNIGPFCRLVHNEGLALNLPGAAGEFQIQVARDAGGADLVGDVKATSGDTLIIPIDATWNKTAKVQTSRSLASAVVAESKNWRRANGGKKPQELLYFGAFAAPTNASAMQLKDALGYNTNLPDPYAKSHWHGLHQHVFGVPAIQQFATTYADKANLRFLSFGDEISLGSIDFNSPDNLQKFRRWLVARGTTAAELGVAPDQATLVASGNPRLVWYSNLFNEEERFAEYRASTEAARASLGPHMLTGANYSPHHLALCYGPIFQWIDIFKHNGMSMFWGEDYIFSVPEAPQIISWMFAQVRCGVKYNNQPIHFYIMPHAPGQTAGFLRRNMVASIGYGARHIDSFWVAPEEGFTENYVAWGYNDTFRAIGESIYDSAEAEPLAIDSKMRPARVAVIIGKATDFNESRLMVPRSQDPFLNRCRNAPETVNQILCRKDQQMLYLALVQAQHRVDLVTEDDIVERDELKNYDVVYFAGEWIDTRALPKLDAWVQQGGVLYAAAGLGHLNQFGEPEAGLLKILGLSGVTTTKNLAVVRTLLELPLAPTIDTLTLGTDKDAKIEAVGMKQKLTPTSAKVLGTWSDGSAAVTVNEYGKGKAFAVGTLAGNSYMKTAVRVQPWPRGGRKQVYNPVDYSPDSTTLVRLGIEAKPVEQQTVCSKPFVEAIVRDNAKGALLTLVNWSNEPIDELEVKVRLTAAPKSARSVSAQAELPVKFADGWATIKLKLAEADFVLLPK